MKLSCLAIWEIFFVTLLRIPSRLVSLVSGDFVRAGIYLGRKEWNEERRLHAIDHPEASPLGKRSLYGKILKHTVWQLAKNIAKLVTYPLAMLGMTFSALYGIINPLDGRRLFGLIEHAWSRDILPKNEVFIMLNDYLARCMQPKSVIEKVLYSKTNNISFSDSLAYIKRNLAKHHDYYIREGIKIESLSKTIQEVKNQKLGQEVPWELFQIKSALKTIKHLRKLLCDRPSQTDQNVRSNPLIITKEVTLSRITENQIQIETALTAINDKLRGL
jgi:hypothetical protein